MTCINVFSDLLMPTLLLYFMLQQSQGHSNNSGFAVLNLEDSLKALKTRNTVENRPIR